ncbi:virulence factor-related M protein isoform X3 [Nilaparvata lugens]|nr:virulence factor-related M protein isoform X3 [Nilaparvata lugens]
MSDTRRWSRPRTRVYDCNYNLGEQYYKPVVDSLDRKYGGGIAERLAADEPLSRRSPFGAESSGGGGGGGRSSLMEAADEEFDVGASLQRLKASRAARQELEDELESMSTERMLKKKAATAAAARESLLEGELESALTGGRRRKANYSEQLLDTVGVNGKMHEKLVDEVSTFRRKAQSAIDDFNEELSGRTENSRRLVNLARQRADLLGEEHSVVTVRVKKVPRLTKWTALNATSMTESLEESAAEKAARARARASKARLADLDAEMEALTERGQQREMRVKGLRSLLAETASSATIESSTTQVSSSSVSSASKRERKVNF